MNKEWVHITICLKKSTAQKFILIKKQNNATYDEILNALIRYRQFK